MLNMLAWKAFSGRNRYMLSNIFTFVFSANIGTCPRFNIFPSLQCIRSKTNLLNTPVFINKATWSG